MSGTTKGVDYWVDEWANYNTQMFCEMYICQEWMIVYLLRECMRVVSIEGGGVVRKRPQ